MAEKSGELARLSHRFVVSVRGNVHDTAAPGVGLGTTEAFHVDVLAGN